ncbi:hypothetical protein BJ912DRAFT_968061 [Pholiota molesta]|nr:hypothetical protein BJ912DRAFT_968061 [Pholiota molesta]
MIVQAHAHHLIAAIHHDLVRRKAILFAKAANLDADSKLLWKKDASFFHNVMQQMDLFNVGEIDEITLYKRIPYIKKYTEKATSDAAAAAASAATISAAAASSAAVVASAARTNAEAGSLATKLARIQCLLRFVTFMSSNSLLLKKITTSQDLQPLLPISPISDWSEHKVAPLKQRQASTNHLQILPSPMASAISNHSLIASSVSPEPMPLRTRKVLAPAASDECDDNEAEAVSSPPQPAAKVVKAQRGMQEVPKSTQAEAINEAELSEDAEERPQKRKLRSARGLQKGQKNGQNTIVREDDDDEPPAPKQKKRKGKKMAMEESSEPEVDELDSTSSDEKEITTSIRVSRRDLQGTEQLYTKPCSLCSSRKTPCEKPQSGGSCVGCKVWKMKCMYAGYQRNTPKKLKTAQQKRDTGDSGRVEVTTEEQEPASMAIRPTASTPQLGASSSGSMAVKTTNADPNEARLQRIEAGYANIERMLLALSQQL